MELGLLRRSGVRRRKGAVRLEKGYSELNHLEEIDITPQCLIVIVGLCGKLADGSRDNTWEFGVLDSTCERSYK